VNPLWIRKPTAILALACAVIQLALGSTLVMSALLLGSHASAHEHSFALHSDGDHVDLVLSHAAVEEHEHPPGTPDHVHPPTWSGGDHVVHIKRAEVANASQRRAIIDPLPVFVISIVSPASAPASWAPRAAPACRAHSVDQLRSVVLLI
jgi:hypothetical protein